MLPAGGGIEFGKSILAKANETTISFKNNNPLLINGARASGGVATLDVCRCLSMIGTNAGDTTQTVTVTGTSVDVTACPAGAGTGTGTVTGTGTGALS